MTGSQIQWFRIISDRLWCRTSILRTPLPLLGKVRVFERMLYPVYGSRLRVGGIKIHASYTFVDIIPSSSLTFPAFAH